MLFKFYKLIPFDSGWLPLESILMHGGGGGGGGGIRALFEILLWFVFKEKIEFTGGWSIADVVGITLITFGAPELPGASIGIFIARS